MKGVPLPSLGAGKPEAPRYLPLTSVESHMLLTPDGDHATAPQPLCWGRAYFSALLSAAHAHTWLLPPSAPYP